MRYRDLAGLEDAALYDLNFDVFFVWAESTEEAYSFADDEYRVVLPLEKDDEDSGISGQSFAIFKTTTARDLFVNIN